VLAGRQLEGVVAVGDARDRQAVEIAHLRIEVDPVAELRRVLRLHREGDDPVAEGALPHQPLEARPVEAAQLAHRLPVDRCLEDRPLAAADLDDAAERPVGIAGHAAEIGEAVGHGAAAVAVGALLVDADGVGLEVEGEVAADHAAAVSEIAAGQEEDARVLDRAGAQDVAIGAERHRLAVGADGLHPGHLAAAGVGQETHDPRLAAQLAVAAHQRAAQRGHRR
jgi:hypothetical protein